MSRKRAAAAIATLALILASACSSTPAPKPPPAPAQIENPGKKSITVTLADGGARLVLERGQELVVRLPLQPTSRLEWAPVDWQSGVLTIRRSGYEQTGWSPAVDEGTAGTSYWQFAPQAAGEVMLRFELRQPHRLDPPAQTVGYSVTVK